MIETLEHAAERAIAAKRAGGSRIEIICYATCARSNLECEVFPGCLGRVLGRDTGTDGPTLLCSVAIADVLRSYGLMLRDGILGDARVAPRRAMPPRRLSIRG